MIETFDEVSEALALSRFAAFDRRHETIAASRNGGDVSSAGPTFAQRSSKRRDIDLEIALFDNGVGPNARRQLVLGDQLSRSLDQRSQDLEGAATETNERFTFQQQVSRWMEAERAKRLVGGLHSLGALRYLPGVHRDAVRRVHLGARRLR